jgi:hypothetical protein
MWSIFVRKNEERSYDRRVCGLKQVLNHNIFLYSGLQDTPHSPLLVGMSTEDPFIYACDEFVSKATVSGHLSLIGESMEWITGFEKYLIPLTHLLIILKFENRN